MAVNYAELAKRLQATPTDVQGSLTMGDDSGEVSFSELEQKYGGDSVAMVDTAVTTPVMTGAPKKPGGFVAGVARAVAPIGESIGAALGTFGAKKMEADTAKRQEELSRVAISLIKNKNLSAEQKARALKAMQISKDVGVIGQSGAFEETAKQTFGKALSTIGSVGVGAGSSAAAKLGLKGGAGLAARAAGEAAMGGATFGLGGGLQEDKQGGELAKSVLTSAVASAAFGVAGEGLGAGLEFLSKKIPSRTINAILRTKASDFNFGKNPGGQVVEEGIVANTRGGFLKSITERRQQVGEEIGTVLKQASSEGNVKMVDLNDALGPIKQAKAKAAKMGESELYKRLQDIEDGLTNTSKVQLGKVVDIPPSPIERMNLRKQLRQLPITEQAKKRQIYDQIAKQAVDEKNREVKLLEQIAKAEKNAAPKRANGYDIQKSSGIKEQSAKEIEAAKEAIQLNKEAGIKTREALRTKLQQIDESGNRFREQAKRKLAPGYGKKQLKISVEKAQELKQMVGESTKWNGQPHDNEVNAVKRQVYHAMDNIIDQAVPAVKKLNDRYANLLTAQKALEKAISASEGQNLIRLNTLLTGLGAAGGAATGDGTEDRVLRGLAGAGAAAAIRSPATLTRFAQYAKRAAPPTSVGGQATVEMLKRLAQSSLQSGLK